MSCAKLFSGIFILIGIGEVVVGVIYLDATVIGYGVAMIFLAIYLLAIDKL